ncbi:coiled-coil domain-containing protein 186-like [Trematomus bernacchii]|uniref:coiled-coil domain-containing protein 186-like n=1 Tax=Trematomus bernacchii TaxID=40690 RepID=UPI00146C64CE|nr:coiled-coil domain-containing protein 186-like [Trematomus bernacchii]
MNKMDRTEDSERSERYDKSSGLQEALDEERKAKAEEQTKSSSLQMNNEAAVSQQKKEAEELARLTQHLTYENKRLQSELEAAVNKQHIEEKKLQDDRRAYSRLEENLKNEEARFSRASQKIQSQEKELSEKTLALEGLQRDYEAAVSQQKKEAEELARLTQRNQHLAYENKRLQSELEAAVNKQHIEEKQSEIEEIANFDDKTFEFAEEEEEDINEQTSISSNRENYSVTSFADTDDDIKELPDLDLDPESEMEEISDFGSV